MAVGDVDGDALFAFRAQAVGDQSEIGQPAAAVRVAAQRVELVFGDGAGVVQQAADQRRLAVVDAARGREPQ